ncbi:MAG TPA: hypothetical protein VEG60_10670 [Candidatus Binatia bacterium]|nr:hypothetical protein [Candidatus Binatia bacterium]
MILVVRIGLLVILMSLSACAGQIQDKQISQPIAEEKAQKEQPKKPAMPTFTYRPG